MGRQGVIYLLSGTKHACRLVVSLHTLRQHYTGPATVISTDSEAAVVCQAAAQDERLQVTHVNVPLNMQARHSAQVFKTRMSEVTPYEITVFLDCDTTIAGDISPLFHLPTPRHVLVTQFCNWQTRRGRIARRIREWSSTCPELISDALGYGKAINTGVFAFTHDSEILREWQALASRGATHFIPDEIAMQLLVPHHPHTILDDRFNCSVKYGAPNASDIRIIHYHGNKHLWSGCSIWRDAYQAAYDQNVAEMQTWSPCADRHLRKFLQSLRAARQHE